ncbi:MAG: aminotransferase class I/II-fold pyridoxal phosphate-dependent enzyme [Sphaerochaetaceae bacterium]|nr:aminotransferase class I/II-fold pyridoxal phosphate-dependent enzyme [Sphaerochaetaceae bacterium]
MSQFDHPADRHGTVSEKYNKDLIELFSGNREAEPFWVADMDFSSPAVIIDALRRELDTGVLGYVGNQGIIPDFLSFVQKRHEWEPDASHVVIAPGMLASIAMLLDTYSVKDDAVLLPFPAYKPFVSILHKLERKIVPLHLSYNEHSHTFSFPLGEYEELMDRKDIRIVLFCSPHNPSGMVFSPETLQGVARVAERREALIISDEIHADLVYEGVKHLPMGKVTDVMKVRTATCMAPSKTFNIAGEHFSMVVCSDRQMKRELVKKLDSYHLAPDYLAMTAARAAYSKGHPWLMELIPYLEENAAMIQSLLSEHDSRMRFIAPSASFIALIDCSEILAKIQEKGGKETIPSGEAGYLSHFFGTRAGIALNDGSWFGSAYSSFVRFNYATSRSRVKEAILAMIGAERELFTL